MRCAALGLFVYIIVKETHILVVIRAWVSRGLQMLHLKSTPDFDEIKYFNAKRSFRLHSSAPSRPVFGNRKKVIVLQTRMNAKLPFFFFNASNPS